MATWESKKKVHVGEDNLVRVVTMKGVKGDLLRFIIQICRLSKDNLHLPPGQYVRY